MAKFKKIFPFWTKIVNFWMFATTISANEFNKNINVIDVWILEKIELDFVETPEIWL